MRIVQSWLRSFVQSKWKRHLAHDMPFYGLHKRKWKSMFAQHEAVQFVGRRLYLLLVFTMELREREGKRKKKHVKRTNLIFKFNTHTHARTKCTQANIETDAASKWIPFRSGRCGILLRWFSCKVNADLSSRFAFFFLYFAKPSAWCDEFKWKPTAKTVTTVIGGSVSRLKRTKEKEISTNKTIKKWHPICVRCVIYFNEYNFQNISKISSGREWTD